MQKTQYNILGVMSGTSLDGIDLAHIHFKIEDNGWKFELKTCKTIGYSKNWVERLKNAVDNSPTQLAELNEDYTVYLAKVVTDFISKNNITNLDAVCSHGHTILHQPQNGFTLQIGNLPKIASLTQQTVVCDFRVQDVQLGGQGAPLVPIGDKILFSSYDYCINLGGFSNISYEQNHQRLAFDISPVNTVLNFYANQLGLDYDDKGQLARSGSINKALLAQLNQLEYYQKTPPKSLGIEYVKTIVLPIIELYQISIADKLCTFCQHIAQQTALALPVAFGKMLITGGGAYNDFLIEKMKQEMPQLQIIIPEPKIIEFKEALLFGLLGVLKLRNETNVLCSVTGAKHDHCSGSVFLYQ